MTPRQKRWLQRGVAMLAALALLVSLAGYAAARVLKQHVLELLGPGAEVGAMQAGFDGLLLHDVHMPAPQGWPAGNAADAEHVRIVPELRSLLGGVTRIRSLELQRARIVVLRQGGDRRLKLLPAFTERKHRDDDGPRRRADLNSIELSDCEVVWVDQTVPQPPLTLHIQQVQGRIAGLDLPHMEQRTQVQLEGKIQGPQHDGTVQVAGWIQLSSRDSELKTRLQGVDLDAVQPYVQRDSARGTQHGLLDLQMESHIQGRQLHAPGSLRLSQMSFSPSEGGSFFGAPRVAALNFFEKQHDHMDLSFEVEGDLSNPKFSVDEDLSTRIALAAGKVLGVSVEGVAKGVGTLGSKSVEAVKGVGSGIGKLFGLGHKDDKPEPAPPKK